MNPASDASLVQPASSPRLPAWAPYVGVAGVVFGLALLLMRSGWLGSLHLHTLQEVVATTLALVVGALALLRYSIRREGWLFILGIGFVGTALLDGLHAFVTTEWFSHVWASQPPSLAPWSWSAPRTLLGTLMLMSCWVGRDQGRGVILKRISEAGLIACVAGLTLLCFAFFALVPLPQAHYPDFFLGRPQELVPGALFVAALIGYLREGTWRSDPTHRWLVMSLVLGVCCQLLVMPHSFRLYDGMFDFAHLLKISSYLCLVVGFLRSTHDAFRCVESLNNELTQAAGETARLRQVEVALRQVELASKIELADRQSRLDMALSASGVGTWVWDVSENTLMWDDRMHEIFSTDRETFVPSFEGFAQTLLREDRARVSEEVQASLEEMREFGIEYRIHGKEGEVRYIAARGLPTSTAKGVLFPGVCMDVTERREAEAQLAEFSEALTRSNADLARFAYIASHDLKAPLRAIDNLSSWLAEDLGDSLSKEGANYVSLLRGRVNRMERLLDDLLDYSRAGRATEGVEEVETRGIAEGVVSLLGLPERFEIQIAPDLPNLETDRVALELVFRNLIDNASKHHKPQGGLIRVTGEVVEESCVFRVSDDGPGIAPEFRERVFEIFQTLRPRDEVEGSGIGLSLVRRVVERQGGTVAVETAPEGGACLVFSLPRRAAA